MRCDNCGWSNPDGLTKCQKCNQDLVPPISVEPVSAPQTLNAINHTIIDPNRHSASPQLSSAVSCLRCGYPLSASHSFCPNCGTQIQQGKQDVQPAHSKTVRVLPEELVEPVQVAKPVEPALKATVREIPAELMDNARFSKTVRVLPEEMLVEAEPEKSVEPSFKLTPMDNFDGATSQVKEFTGADSVIGRDVLVTEGSYMPESLEIEFSCKEGQWTVTDKSGSKAVFVSAAHPLTLNPGDIIVIGNRRFIFE